jgi:endonuclease-3 related protein
VPSDANLALYYRALFQAWGRQHWWPARTRFEVIVGAYLTQNTAWTNVEKAVRNLRRAGVLSLNGIRRTPLPQLEQLIRSAGYFRQKAQRLQNFVEFLDARYGGSLDRMFARPTQELRQELLALNGVGPETADSILLYAGNHPVFVVDAYTRRILDRHRILALAAPYDEIRELVERELSAAPDLPISDLPAEDVPVLVPSPGLANAKAENANPASETRTLVAHPPSPMSTTRRSRVAQVYNEMHGLIVRVGKHHCQKKRAICEGCPLERFLPAAGPREVRRAPKRLRRRGGRM